MNEEVMQTPEFLGIKKDYNIFFGVVEGVQKKFNIYFLIDYTGKAVIIYHLQKTNKSFRKIKSASYFTEFISDKYYNTKFKSINDAKKSLTNLITSRLELEVNNANG